MPDCRGAVWRFSVGTNGIWPRTSRPAAASRWHNKAILAAQAAFVLSQCSMLKAVADWVLHNINGDHMDSANIPSLAWIATSLCAIVSMVPTPSHAQTNAAPGFSSKLVQTSPVSGDESKQIVLMAVSIQPGAAVPPHTHPGDCVGALVEGTVDLLVMGKEARRLAAGDSYTNPQGTVHWFRNAGDGPARLLNTLVVVKGVPPVQPASAPR